MDVDNNSSLDNVKKRIEEILSDNELAINAVSKKNNEKSHEEINAIDPLLSLSEQEIKLDPARIIMSKTDAKGIIEFANDYFMQISGYEEYELMGRPHNIIRHPDMPKVIFKLMWERLHKGENIYAIVKNLTKDGRYYWVLTNFETKYDTDGNIVSHYARRKAVPNNAIHQIEKLYRTILLIEQNRSVEIAEKYFYSMLEEKGKTYDEYILHILNLSPAALKDYFRDPKANPKPLEMPKVTQKKRGVFKKIFGK